MGIMNIGRKSCRSCFTTVKMTRELLHTAKTLAHGHTVDGSRATHSTRKPSKLPVTMRKRAALTRAVPTLKQSAELRFVQITRVSHPLPFMIRRQPCQPVVIYLLYSRQLSPLTAPLHVKILNHPLCTISLNRFDLHKSHTGASFHFSSLTC